METTRCKYIIYYKNTQFITKIQNTKNTKERERERATASPADW